MSHIVKTVNTIGVAGSAGAFAEYVRVSARETFALPATFTTGEGALVEPLAVALHAVEAAEIKPGDACIGNGRRSDRSRVNPVGPSFGRP